MLKHRELMYNKNVKRTFEILRSEITFLMDLYRSLLQITKAHMVHTFKFTFLGTTG